MSEKTSTQDRTELAEKRTDWAEDRTVLANERTFAGWMRTGLAAAGLGLGFNAVFKQVEPTWLAKAVATVFIAISILIFLAAFRSARSVIGKMDSHSVEPVKAGHLSVITILFIAGDLALATVLWIL